MWQSCFALVSVQNNKIWTRFTAMYLRASPLKCIIVWVTVVKMSLFWSDTNTKQHCFTFGFYIVSCKKSWCRNYALRFSIYTRIVPDWLHFAVILKLIRVNLILVEIWKSTFSNPQTKFTFRERNFCTPIICSYATKSEHFYISQEVTFCIIWKVLGH